MDRATPKRRDDEREGEVPGATVMEPPGCKVENGMVETTEFTAHADYMHEGKAFAKLEPTKGPGTTFAVAKVIECALETSLVVNGVVFGERVNKTEVPAKEQPITLSEVIHKTTESTLNANGITAILEGCVVATLASESFGAK